MMPGELVADRYRLERKLGEGGMGAVWAATHVVTRKAVAIKLLKPELAHNPSLVERFLREARAACAVKHRHVVQIHDVLQLENGAPLMVMDLLEGESLADRLVRDGRIPVPDFSRIMLQVISAVAAAHAAHVVHRDLKPDNLFLARTDDGTVDLQVLDFGIAKVSTTDAEAGVLTKTGSMLGTPFYMAPEQLFGEKDVDRRADIWSLGIIAYECLTGRRPTEADNLGQIIKLVTTGGIAPLANVAPFVPPDICVLVGRMLTSDRSARLTDLDEAKLVFERYAGGNASEAPPAHISARPSSPVDRLRDDAQPPVGTGPMHWAATQPEPRVSPPPRRAFLLAMVSLLAAGLVLVGMGFVVRRVVASYAQPSDGGVASGSATPPTSTGEARTQASSSAVAPPSSVDVAGTVAEPIPPAEPVPTASSRTGVASTRTPSVRVAPSASASAPARGSVAIPVTTSSQGVLVDKPPF